MFSVTPLEYLMHERNVSVLITLVFIPSTQSTAQYTDESMNLSEPFPPIYKSEVFCTCCEEHNIRKQLASTVAKSDPVCHKTSRLLSPLLHITISSSIWKSWRQRSLMFAPFYSSDCSNISPSVSSLFCVMIYCPHREDGAITLVLPTQHPVAFSSHNTQVNDVLESVFHHFFVKLLSPDYSNRTCNSYFHLSIWSSSGVQFLGQALV